jgi:hypothetical protein
MSKIQLKNVRLSYPSLFNKAVFEGNEGKYEATFIIPKDDEKIKAKLDKAIAEALKEAKIKTPGEDKICLKDGDEAETSDGEPIEAYADSWTMKASSSKRPTVIARDKTPVVESDEVFYPGCYVNAVVDIWIQNNKFGKRVNANLYGVQFVEDGEPLGMGNVDVTDDFDDLDDI